MPKAKEKMFETSSIPQFISNIHDNNAKFSNFLEEFYSHKNILEDDFDVNYIELCNGFPSLRTENENELHEIEYTIKQINLSKVIRKKFVKLFDGHSNNEMQFNDGSNFYYSLFSPTNKFIVIALRIFIMISFFQKVVYELVLCGLRKRIPIFGRSLYEMKVLRSLSNQIRFKLSVMKTWPILIKILTHEKQSPDYSSILRIYIKLFSGIFLIASDLILGILSLFFLYYNIQHILGFVHKYGSGFTIFFIKFLKVYLIISYTY